MNIAVLHFSARNDGNCAAIAQELTKLHTGHHVEIHPVCEAALSPCRNCAYECFHNAASCPYAQDDVPALYTAILHSDLTYFVLPNYADSPPALYFAFNERSNCFFQGNEELLNAYLAVPKRFIIVSNQPSPIFDALPQYHIAEGITPKLLYLPPRQYCQNSLDGTMMEATEACACLQRFVLGHDKNAMP
ncbi:MAG: NAD(P)H-dependent oxidoreductase [Clostridia bacterium]|nr:NAD(P)H-dependent oxidoreductase [Clostridia bacterium]